MTYCLVLYLDTASENILCRSFNVKFGDIHYARVRFIVGRIAREKYL